MATKLPELVARRTTMFRMLFSETPVSRGTCLCHQLNVSRIAKYIAVNDSYLRYA